ncbi:aminoacyl-histidine dipeptidase [[Clostridium] polysaccharolyticum]|uniref:Cytosol non-specific dipeptidase n=1 Tax=[Clostridium] polysaccharolyticum TaxID=29364 RepID=A0A1I0AZ50_9FIRM|nr:aminoacyl-histidine dipeptidase [[Clostridium] polysaccharolyticum]SES99304.1 dipeptidase D [[Clostridium] polysaccharolyticum]
MVLDKIDYKKVFSYFEEISNIPRGSKNNREISDFLLAFGKENGLECYQDEALNVILIKEATPGLENVPAIMIQGHMDMVCEKESETEHDFFKEGLELAVEGDYVYAKGTTLGGDDGIALAMAMSILTDKELAHPRLEAVFTTDEEIGMDGAAVLDTSKLRSKYLINIDSEVEGILTVGCAGGMTSTLTLPLERSSASGVRAKISIKGLQGGHSGIEVTKNRTNGNMLLGRLLSTLKKKVDFQVITLWGGLKDNAIPRESFGELLLDSANVEVFKAAVKELAAVYGKELASSEPMLAIELELDKDVKEYPVLTKNTFDKVLAILLFTPNGIQAMSSDIDGLVESSLNLGIFKMGDDEAVFSYSVRSSKSAYKDFMSDKLEILVTMLGGTYNVHGVYPAWELMRESKLTEICKKVYREQYGEEMVVEVIHAGLECGILSSKMKELDIVSIGPNMLDIHTPSERMSISSVKRVYDYVLGVIAEINRQ